jgi:hypothetical protein
MGFLCVCGSVVIGMLMVRGTRESRAEAKGAYTFDTIGVVTFMVAVVALQVLATQGAKFGWTSAISLALLAAAIVFGGRRHHRAGGGLLTLGYAIAIVAFIRVVRSCCSASDPASR